ncbi:MAG: hypothetical protein IJC16_00130 [Rikenellaceae bacterium]|nr:hypothetical protein [Rikenellaceae bacterium]
MPEKLTYKGRPVDFSRAAARFVTVRRQLPRIWGTVAVNYFKDSFRRQGWRDRTLKKWPDRKKGVKGRAILIGRGHLRNSIRIETATFRRTVVGSNLPYAAAHNEGVQATVTVRAHTRRIYGRRKEEYVTRAGHNRTRSVRYEAGSYEVRQHTRRMNLPQRRFAGNSEVMNRKLDAVTARALDVIFDI